MHSLIVIPARFHSVRFPGKPLANILGQSLLERTIRLARAVKPIQPICVATDDSHIAAAAKRFDVPVVLSDHTFQNGSERAYAVIKALNVVPKIITVFQADAVLTPPWVLASLIEHISTDENIQIATPAMCLSGEKLKAFAKQKALRPSAGTTVVSDCNGFALYFSKHLLPFFREKETTVWRHIGVYSYRLEALQKYASLPLSSLEQAEGLEQLRALENNLPIKVIPVDYYQRTHWSVDFPEDIPLIEQIIAQEGELV